MVMLRERWLNFTSISFLGLIERCQYLQHNISIELSGRDRTTCKFPQV